MYNDIKYLGMIGIIGSEKYFPREIEEILPVFVSKNKNVDLYKKKKI
jgi:hypothetical protein